MSPHGSIENASMHIAQGLEALGGSIERAMTTYVALQRERSVMSQEIARSISEGIGELVEELRKG